MYWGAVCHMFLSFVRLFFSGGRLGWCADMLTTMIRKEGLLSVCGGYHYNSLAVGLQPCEDGEEPYGTDRNGSHIRDTATLLKQYSVSPCESHYADHPFCHLFGMKSSLFWRPMANIRGHEVLGKKQILCIICTPPGVPQFLSRTKMQQSSGSELGAWSSFLDTCLAVNIPPCWTLIYGTHLFPCTIKEWNLLPHLPISQLKQVLGIGVGIHYHISWLTCNAVLTDMHIMGTFLFICCCCCFCALARDYIPILYYDVLQYIFSPFLFVPSCGTQTVGSQTVVSLFVKIWCNKCGGEIPNRPELKMQSVMKRLHCWWSTEVLITAYCAWKDCIAKQLYPSTRCEFTGSRCPGPLTWSVNVGFNGPIPAGTCDLPAAVSALLEKSWICPCSLFPAIFCDRITGG